MPSRTRSKKEDSNGTDAEPVVKKKPAPKKRGRKKKVDKGETIVLETLRTQLKDEVRDQLKREMEEKVTKELTAELRTQLEDSLRDEISEALREQLTDQVRETLRAEMKEKIMTETEKTRKIVKHEIEMEQTSSPVIVTITPPPPSNVYQRSALYGRTFQE